MWIMEKLGFSYAKYQELRLQLFGRFFLLPCYIVITETHRTMPALQDFHRVVKASLYEGLKLTLEEQLSLLDSVPDIAFGFTYGIDGSGQHTDYEQKSKKGYSTIFRAFSKALSEDLLPLLFQSHLEKSCLQEAIFCPSSCSLPFKGGH